MELQNIYFIQVCDIFSAFSSRHTSQWVSSVAFDLALSLSLLRLVSLLSLIQVSGRGTQAHWRVVPNPLPESLLESCWKVNLRASLRSWQIHLPPLTLTTWGKSKGSSGQIGLLPKTPPLVAQFGPCCSKHLLFHNDGGFSIFTLFFGITFKFLDGMPDF